MDSSYSCIQSLSEFDEFPNDSRVWIWQLNQQLTSEKEIIARNYLQSFVRQWTSHNIALSARAEVCYNRFFVVVLDASVNGGASGCSIDSLTKSIQSLASNLEVNAQDRTQFCFWKNERIYPIHMNELAQQIKDGTLTMDDLVFDNLVSTKLQLSKNWLRPLKDSWHQRFAS